jgi:hypothetical protein
MTTGSVGSLSETVNRLNGIHETLKARRAAGLLTETQYAKAAGGLLNMLANFDGLIAETANGTSR